MTWHTIRCYKCFDYKNDFVTLYRLIHSRGRFSAGRRIYFVGRGDFSHGAAGFLTSHHPPAGDFPPPPPATIGGGGYASWHRPPEMSGLTADPSADGRRSTAIFDWRRNDMPPSNCHRRGHIVSPPPGWYLVYAAAVWIRSTPDNTADCNQT